MPGTLLVFDDGPRDDFADFPDEMGILIPVDKLSSAAKRITYCSS
jgi:hypothetical protein